MESKLEELQQMMYFTGRLGRATRSLGLAVCVTLPLITARCGTEIAGLQPDDTAYEVWLADQSDTKGRTFGGTLYIYAATDLAGGGAASAQPRERIDLATETATLCMSATGANPVRPHMLLFNREHTHAVLSFVASGHVVIFDAATRKPLRCVRTSRSATGQQAHAAFPAPDGSFIVIANQNGKRLERIDVNFATSSFTHNAAATLDLATCTTPSGAPCQGEPRPDNAPICPIVDGASRYAFVTLRGGGLFVVDARSTPMRIVAEYDKATVKGNGCGGTEVAGNMYINSGGRPGNLAHLNLFGFDVYKFPLGGYATTNPVNTPAATRVFSIEGEHDSHGMVARGTTFIWVMDRHANAAEIISVASGTRVNTVRLTGALSDDPAPDLVDIAPSGNRLFVALRGPTPLSGDPHIATGKTPGLGIIDLTDGGRSGALKAIVRVTNVDSTGVERADAHAVRVRRIGVGS
ncbi:MAG: hypothetical protein ACT4P6_03695 [Gemmatimonadaceae bacterium]